MSDNHPSDPGGLEDIAILDAIKAVREKAADERVAMHERGEPLSDYSSGVLDGIDNAMLAARRAVRRPEDRREVTSPEEWWACEDAYQAGIDHAVAVLNTEAACTCSPAEVENGRCVLCGRRFIVGGAV